MRIRSAMCLKRAGVSALAVGLLALPAQHAAASTIYNETFSGAGTTDLNGTAPDTTTGGEVWSASTDWKKDGSIVAGGITDDNAFLAFTPESGKVYTLSATLATPSGAWAAVGFTETANTGGGTGNDDFWRNNPDEVGPWVLYRSSTNVDSFLGPLTGGAEDEGDHVGPITLSIELNTQGAAWSAEWFINGGSVRSETFATNPTNISYVGLSRESGAGASFDNFSLTVVPEPGSLALLGLGGLLIARRRHG